MKFQANHTGKTVYYELVIIRADEKHIIVAIQNRDSSTRKEIEQRQKLAEAKEKAEAARDESGGIIDCVTDEEIIEAYRTMARTEGILAEPASAASVAGLIKANKKGLVKPDSIITCTLTGNGLKDPDSAIKYSACEIKKTGAQLSEIVKVMEF